MDCPEIVRFIHEDFAYTREGWEVSAMVVPCPHVLFPGDWVLVLVSYVEPDTTPGAAGQAFAQTRRILLDPTTISGEDDLVVWLSGSVLWSVVHEHREQVLVRGKAPHFPHHTGTRSAWDRDRADVLTHVE